MLVWRGSLRAEPACICSVDTGCVRGLTRTRAHPEDVVILNTVPYFSAVDGYN